MTLEQKGQNILWCASWCKMQNYGSMSSDWWADSVSSPEMDRVHYKMTSLRQNPSCVTPIHSSDITVVTATESTLVICLLLSHLSLSNCSGGNELRPVPRTSFAAAPGRFTALNCHRQQPLMHSNKSPCRVMLASIIQLIFNCTPCSDHTARMECLAPAWYWRTLNNIFSSIFTL